MALYLGFRDPDLQPMTPRPSLPLIFAAIGTFAVMLAGAAAQERRVPASAAEVRLS
jgi:hypothetical protein